VLEKYLQNSVHIQVVCCLFLTLEEPEMIWAYRTAVSENKIWINTPELCQ